MILEPIDAEAKAYAENLADPSKPPSIQEQEDMRILALVLQDVQLSDMRDREWNKMASWDDVDDLYLFRVPQQRWEGSTTPRASMGVPLVLEHVNAINNQIGEVLWEEDPPFHVDGYGSYEDQTMEQRANIELLRCLLNKAEAEVEVDRGSHGTLLYGTGIWKSYWEMKNGYFCPVLESLNRRYVRVASNLRFPDIRRADWKAHVTFKMADQIDSWRMLPGFRNIPELDELKKLGQHPKQRSGFTPVERGGHAYSSMNLNPEFEPPDPSRPASANPAQHPIEIIEYKNNNYIYTILAKTRVIRVIPDPADHGVRYYSAYLIPVEGQFDGIGLGVLLGNEQRLQQGLLNTSIDNLALSLLGMFIRKKGSSIFPNQIKVRPGVVFDVDDINDLAPVKFTPVDPVVFDQITASDSRSQRRSGANEVTVQGSFPETSGGIGRTAEGMSALAQGSSARIRKYVKTIEQQVLIPFLEWLVETVPMYMSKKQIKEIIGQELADAWKPVMWSKMKFKMLSATKLKRRAAMIQAMPTLINFYQQDATQAQLKDQFQKLNFNEINWMWTDATGYPVKGNLVQDMEQDEIEKMMSENELVQQLLVEKAKAQMQTDMKIQVSDAENAGRAFRDVLKAALDQQKIDQQQYHGLLQMLGQASANSKFDQQQQAQQMQGQMNGTNQQQQSPGTGKSLGITPY